MAEQVDIFNPVDDAILELSTYTGYTIDEITGESRRKDVIQWRAAVCVSLRAFGYTTEKIGKHLNRDHSSIVHHTQKHESNLRFWEGYSNKYNTCILVFSDKFDKQPNPIVVSKQKTRKPMGPKNKNTLYKSVIIGQDLLTKQLTKLIEKVDGIIDCLESGNHATKHVIPVSEFVERGYMSRSRFYKCAPHGEVAGAVKIGAKWFVNVDEFLESVKAGEA